MATQISIPKKGICKIPTTGPIMPNLLASIRKIRMTMWPTHMFMHSRMERDIALIKKVTNSIGINRGMSNNGTEGGQNI